MCDDCILLSNVISTKLSLKSPFESLRGAIPILHTRLKMFSEVEVVTTNDKIQAKLSNQGTTCISGVGMLLYLTKYSCPDICSIVRELSK